MSTNLLDFLFNFPISSSSFDSFVFNFFDFFATTESKSINSPQSLSSSDKSIFPLLRMNPSFTALCSLPRTLQSFKRTWSTAWFVFETIKLLSSLLKKFSINIPNVKVLPVPGGPQI